LLLVPVCSPPALVTAAIRPAAPGRCPRYGVDAAFM
jgi:hypothetical protein